MEKNEPQEGLGESTSCIAKLFFMKESDDWEELYVGKCEVVKKVGVFLSIVDDVLTLRVRRTDSGASSCVGSRRREMKCL